MITSILFIWVSGSTSYESVGLENASSEVCFDIWYVNVACAKTFKRRQDLKVHLPDQNETSLWKTHYVTRTAIVDTEVIKLKIFPNLNFILVFVWMHTLIYIFVFYVCYYLLILEYFKNTKERLTDDLKLDEVIHNIIYTYYY